MSVNTASHASAPSWASERQESDPAWLDLLQKTRVIDVLPGARPLVKASINDDIATLLKKLAEAKVLAAVVADSSKPGVLGFVDVLDLMTLVLDIASESKDISRESIRNLKWEGQCFARTPTGDVINLSESDPFALISSEAALLEAVTLFAKGTHRLAVTDKTDKIINIITQFDVVDFLAPRGVWLGSKMDKPIVEVGLGPLGVASVKRDQNVVDVLRYMRDNKLSGVAVVDNSGRMVANFSATDLQGLNENNWMFLALSVSEFLERIHGFPKPPVVCKVTDTPEVVMMRMLVHKVHRLYVVDDTMVPSGVLTLTDVMQFLLVN